MIYKWLSLLFRNREFYSYVARPADVLWAIFVMAIGYVCITEYKWMLFGVIVFIIGIGLAITVNLAINWEKASEYWEKIAYVFEAASKIKDPVTRAELLRSMGYTAVPETITVIETEQETKEHGFSMKFHKLPFPATVLQAVADTVLSSGKLEFPTEESELGKAIPKYRKTKSYLKKNGLIIPTNPKNVRLGYSFNKKGVDVLYENASESVKLQLRKEGDKNEHKEK